MKTNKHKKLTHKVPFEIDGHKVNLVLGENSYAEVEDEKGTRVKAKTTSSGVKVYNLTPTTENSESAPTDL